MNLRTDRLALKETEETELSRQLVRLIDVLYALALAQGAIYYRRIFTEDNYFNSLISHPEHRLPVVIALILVYFTTIQSFVDYHLASEAHRYRIVRPGVRGRDLVRFYLDFVIVGSYSLLLLKFHVLIHQPGQDLTVAFWAFPAIFVLYLIWGLLRWWAMRTGTTPHPYSFVLLVIMAVLYAVLALAYEGRAPDATLNSSALGAALGLMVLYRALNWPRGNARTAGAVQAPEADPPAAAG